MAKYSEEHEKALNEAWDKYRNSGDTAARHFIINSYTPLVNGIAHEVMRKKPSNFEQKDLFQTGMIGLMSAMERYDPSKGARFATFAQLRIRGAMYDEINSMDWTPRSVRERIKLYIRAVEIHSKISNGAPTDEELTEIIVAQLNKEITVEQVEQARHQYNKTHIHAIDSASTMEQEASRNGFLVTGSQLPEVEDEVSNIILNDTIEDILNTKCTPLEAYVFRKFHHEGVPMKHIAAEMGFRASKVSEVKHRADAVMREELITRGVV